MKNFLKDPANVFVVTILAAVMLLGIISAVQAGKPANSVAFLGDQPQQLVWKNDQAAVFRAPNGTEKFVQIYTALLEVGATYQVRSVHTITKVGYIHTFWLDRI